MITITTLIRFVKNLFTKPENRPVPSGLLEPMPVDPSIVGERWEPPLNYLMDPDTLQDIRALELRLVDIETDLEYFKREGQRRELKTIETNRVIRGLEQEHVLCTTQLYKLRCDRSKQGYES